MNPTHTFTYSARSLRDPLSRLVGYLHSTLKKLDPEMKDAPALAKKRNALATPDDQQVRAMQIMNAHNQIKRDIARAELWLSEVKRAWPWRRFRLTEDECAWLHRYRGGQS